MTLRNILLILAVIALIFSGCLTNNVVKKQYNAEFVGNKTWVNNTIKALKVCRFLTLKPLKPSLYATYHYLSALSLFNRIPDVEKTLKYLQEENSKLFEEPNLPLNEIVKIYYGVESMRILNSTPAHKNELILKILQRKNSDGSSGSGNKLAYTYYAVKSLIDLGYHNNFRKKTKQYV